MTFKQTQLDAWIDQHTITPRTGSHGTLEGRDRCYYVEFPVIESADGKSLVLASSVPGARWKRWKVGCLNKTVAKEMEATIRTRLLLGHE